MGAVRETLVVDDRGWVRLPEPLRRSLAIGDGVQAAAVGQHLELTPDGAPPQAQPPAVVPLEAPLVDGSAAPTDLAASVVAAMRDVTVNRGGREVLHGLGLELRAGGLTVVRGPSGSGKSTLLRILVGLERPDRGSVLLAGVELSTLNRAGLADLRRRTVAVSGQSGSLVEALDVADNLHLARDARGLDRDEPLVEAWLAALGLAALRHRPARVLSGGERQRLAVARTLAVRPRLAVLDEPTSQQDEANAERLVAVLVAAAARGVAVVAATHDPLLVSAADSVVTLA